MKTLDEVIKELQEQIDDEMNCEYSSNWIVSKYDVEDAIHYLKEYRERLSQLQNMMDRYEINDRNYQEAVQNCEMVQMKYQQLLDDYNDNRPLTWKELGTMEGRPVWVEEYDPIDDNKGWRRARWNLIQWANSEDNVIYFVNDEWDQTVYHLSDYGKTWTAYRKERR